MRYVGFEGAITISNTRFRLSSLKAALFSLVVNDATTFFLKILNVTCSKHYVQRPTDYIF